MNIVRSIIKGEKLLLIIALIILTIDFIYSIKQYHNIRIDGDFANIVLPNFWYSKVLNDPLGLSALLDSQKYQATNRFTAHFVMHSYFYNVPLFLQYFCSPIESLYLSVTIAKTLTHFFFLYLISYYVTLLIGYTKINHIIAMAIASPFLINFGLYEYYLGFNDKAITYSMFYTLPLIWLMLYYLPVFKKVFLKSEKISMAFVVLFLPITLLIVLSGPLIAPLILLINFVLLMQLIINNKIYKTFALNNLLLFYLVGIVFSLYSIYLGTFNNENEACNLALADRYKNLFKGLHNIFFTIREGVIFIYALMIFNFFLLRRYGIKNSLSALSVMFLTVIFLYIMLMPLGGCREYRPYILRRDTFLPILTLLLMALTATSMLLIQNRRYMFIIFWLVISVVFWKSDIMPNEYENNFLEKKNLVQLSKSKDSCVTLIEDFPIFGWRPTFDCNESLTTSKLILHYNITSNLILHKNK